MCAQPATHLCRRCATAAVTLCKQCHPPWHPHNRHPWCPASPTPPPGTFVNVQFSTWCYLCLLPFFKKDQNLYWLKSPSRAFSALLPPYSTNLLMVSPHPPVCYSHTLTDVTNCNTIVTVYSRVAGLSRNHNLMNFSPSPRESKWPRLAPPPPRENGGGVYTSHICMYVWCVPQLSRPSRCQAIELSCNCFDFWPRAFIWPRLLNLSFTLWLLVFIAWCFSRHTPKENELFKLSRNWRPASKWKWIFKN